MSQTTAADEFPHAHDFAEQLIRQVLSDLDGVLLEGDAPADEAFPVLANAATAGRTRGGALILLLRAALSAHRALAFGRDDDNGEFEAVDDAEVIEALTQLVPAAAAQAATLLKAASALEHYVAAAEPGVPVPQQTLALAIYRLYEGLRNDDETLGGRGLLELRSLTVHLDATAGMLDQGSVSAEPLRVIRPDRFHDYFLRFTSLAQTQDSAGAERAVAALSRDGRIEALITEDATHPIISAALQVHEVIVGDAKAKDHVLARIRGLLVFLAALRKRPSEQIGDAVADPNVHLSLVIAAATAPLRLGAEFEFAVLAQIARYNQALLRGAQGAGKRAH